MRNGILKNSETYEKQEVDCPESVLDALVSTARDHSESEMFEIFEHDTLSTKTTRILKNFSELRYWFLCSLRWLSQGML